MKRRFSFRSDYLELVEELPDKLQFTFYKAIIKYAFYNEQPRFKPTELELLPRWAIVKTKIDRELKGAKSGKHNTSKISIL